MGYLIMPVKWHQNRFYSRSSLIQTNLLYKGADLILAKMTELSSEKFCRSSKFNGVPIGRICPEDTAPAWQWCMGLWSLQWSFRIPIIICRLVARSQAAVEKSMGGNLRRSSKNRYKEYFANILSCSSVDHICLKLARSN